MTKSSEHRYIDSKKTLLKTANNLYYHSIAQLNKVTVVREKYGEKKAAEFYEMIYADLQESLLFGKAESAPVMAGMHKAGWVGQKNDNRLFVYIGSELKEPQCQELVKGKDFSDVKLEGKQWLKAIKAITKKHPNKDAEITLSDAVWADKKLAECCEQITPEMKNFAKLAKETSSNITYRTSIPKEVKSYGR